MGSEIARQQDKRTQGETNSPTHATNAHPNANKQLLWKIKLG
jgi:hypothetical protein